ncbi:MAG: hypothetical protein CND01_03880 [Marine Group II euryarchaeote MED-G34]|jgi:hypothetical protein|nr:MAG: hypothetical protein CND01_03880 [Marine Group II euryarchaeote MED-G34]
MRTLLEAEPLAPVSETLSQAADQLRSSNTTILLLAAPSLQGALAIAPLEAALVDAGIPYRRRFRLEAPSEGSWVHILGPADESGPKLSSNPLQLSLAGTVVEGLTGHQGDSRKGPLTAVAQSHALAQAICPDGARIRRLRPWVISGNWLHSALDTTYDPVFTALRDTLVQDGSIKVVPLPEVPEPNISASTWIDPAALDAVTSRWPSLDMEGRARALSHLMRPALSRSTPSTARLEEIGWHCVLGPGWSTDLAGQITSAAGLWKENPAAVAAGRVTDSLLRRGVIPQL